MDKQAGGKGAKETVFFSKEEISISIDIWVVYDLKQTDVKFLKIK